MAKFDVTQRLEEDLPEGVVSVEYTTRDEPIQVGTYNAARAWDGPFHYRPKTIWLYGAYRVRLDDGFVYLSPHTGVNRTLSSAPIDLAQCPGYVALLVESAEECRAAHLA